jgi:hypothetical protein
MRPHVSPVADVFGDLLLTDIAPNLTGFRANNASMIGFVMKMIAEEFDRAAHRLVEENAAVRGLLRRAATVFGDASLGAQAGEEDRDLRVSVLEAENDRLRRLLTDIHARCEITEGADVRALEDAIWDELRCSVERRKISLANF